MSLSQIDLGQELQAQLEDLDFDEGDRIEFSIFGEGMLLVLMDVKREWIDNQTVVKVELTYGTAGSPQG